LELVKRGEPVTVTTRGREIATIVPAGPSKEVELLWRMVREGKATWSGGKPKGASRRVSWPGKPLSEIVLEDRGDPLP